MPGCTPQEEGALCIVRTWSFSELRIIINQGGGVEDQWGPTAAEEFVGVGAGGVISNAGVAQNQSSVTGAHGQISTQHRNKRSRPSIVSLGTTTAKHGGHWDTREEGRIGNSSGTTVNMGTVLHGQAEYMEEDLTPLGCSGISDRELTNGSQEQSGPQFSPDDNGRKQEEDAGFQDRLDSTEQQLEQKERGNHHQQLEMQMEQQEQGEQREEDGEQQDGVEEQKTPIRALTRKEKHAKRSRNFYNGDKKKNIL